LAPDLEEYSDLTESEFATRFHHSPIRRAKHAGFLQTVRIALRNASATDRRSIGWK
jgi:epoxyqueuosine reductase